MLRWLKPVTAQTMFYSRRIYNEMKQVNQPSPMIEYNIIPINFLTYSSLTCSGKLLLMKRDIVASLQVDEWWEQPASTVVDWVTVDGQNVAAWWNDVKQLKAFHDQLR